MPAEYFRFKKFTIYQQQCAMKVNTDGVLLGAWACVENCEKILDIGTGTGLLALMMAQRSNAFIDGVEIDTDSFHQAEKNAEGSMWHERIHHYNQSFQNFSNSCEIKYDLIISNPPYFSNCLKSIYDKRNTARHNDQLPFGDLIKGVKKILKTDGKFAIILPIDVSETFSKYAFEAGLFCQKETTVKTTQSKKHSRTLMQFGYKNTPTTSNELIILQDKDAYTLQYRELTKDFYLDF